MIGKIGTAMKKMAQRSMMRGNRGDAQSISDFGITGMRSNLQTQPQNVLTGKINIKNENTHDIFSKETTDKVKAKVENTNINPSTSNKLGSSILDATK